MSLSDKQLNTIFSTLAMAIVIAGAIAIYHVHGEKERCEEMQCNPGYWSDYHDGHCYCQKRMKMEE